MPSIFTRSRTASTPKPRTAPVNVPDEFGRVTSRTSISTPSKKDKKKDKAQPRVSESIEIQVTDGGFFPFYIPPDSEERSKLRSYGYLSYKYEVVLGVDEVLRLVDVVARELTERGFLTTPLLFSSQALDLSRTRIQKLIDTFLATCPSETYRKGSPADQAWLDEARFSGPHELAMTLRWGLARIVRLVNGQESRGILYWESYLRWREDEAASLYPPTYFTSFITSVPLPVQRLLSSLLSLLSRLATHATSSGLTPAALSSLFGPLLFGLGSPSLSFHHTYGAFLRSSHAAEHILLAYIRAQPPPLPSRLADWIKGYPSMLPPPNRLDKARPGSKLRKLNTVKRYVRLFSNDLVKTAAGWDLGNSKEWNRVFSQHSPRLGGPRYSDAYRKQMGLSANDHPETGLPSPDPSLVSYTDENDGADAFAPKEDQLRFRSLTDLKWGEFESMGFLNNTTETEKRLEFDLNEGARNPLPEKRTTLSWSDFSQAGFMRNDAPLSATLQFSAPLSHTISTWPSKQHEIHSKLKKTQKSLPSFNWDTTPIQGGDEAIEESFLETWCEVLYGSGWVRRDERVWRDCSWVLVEYKATPQTRPNGIPPSDPRTATSLWLYEEFIPGEYKNELAQPKRKLLLPHLTLPFSSKQQPNSHGTITAVSPGPSSGPGYTARLPSARELEFEGLLQREASTKIISLGHGLAVGGGSGGGAGARESTMSATLSASELGHPNASEIGLGQGTGEYSTQYVDGSREVSGGPYIPSMEGTSSAHVSSSIAPAPQESSTETGAHLTNTPQHPTLSTAAPGSSPRPDPRSVTQSQTNAASSSSSPQGGFFTVMTTPRKSPARFLAKMSKSKGGGNGGEGGGNSFGDENGQGIEKAKRSRDILKARHSILRKGGKGSEETSIEFETRTIFGVEEGFDGDDHRESDQKGAQTGGDGESTPTQVKFPRAYSHARNISKDDAWVDILVAGSPGKPNMTMTPTTPVRARRSSDPESAAGSSYPLHDPDRVREEIRQALKGAGPKPAEFSDNEADDANSRVDRTSLSLDQHSIENDDDYAEDAENDDEATSYGFPEPSPMNDGAGPDFLDGATNAERVSLPASSPHGLGNGHYPKELPSSAGSSSEIMIAVDTGRDSPLSVPQAGSGLGQKALSQRLPSLNTNTSFAAANPASPPIVLTQGVAGALSHPKEMLDVPDIDDSDSQLQDDDSNLGDPTDLLSGLAVNPATPRYVHGAPLHNVVEEEEE